MPQVQTLAEGVRIAREGGDVQGQHSPTLATREDVDYERARYYEFVLLRSKHKGFGFMANVSELEYGASRCAGSTPTHTTHSLPHPPHANAQEINRIRKTLVMSPRFVAPVARTALLLKLHVLMQFENGIEYQSLEEEVDEDFRPTGCKRGDDSAAEQSEHVEL